MARTKQTAKNSTGGKAPRKRLNSDADAIVISSTEEDNATPRTQSAKAKKAKRAKTSRTARTVLEPEPEPEPERQDEEADNEKPDASLEPGEKVPICTTWRMPKEKEPTGPINYTETSDIYCFMCQNGGDLLACDEQRCHRVMCLKHVPKIQALPKDVLDALHFRCPSCHTLKTRADAKLEEDKEEPATHGMKKNPPIGLQPTGKKTDRWTAQKAKRPSGPEAQQPYHQEHKPQAAQKGKLPPKDRPANPYFGLYQPRTEIPYFSKWIEINAPSSRPQHSRVDTRPLILLNMRLATLREKTSPAKLVYNLCSAWFDGAARNYLRYIDLPFNVIESPQEDLYKARTNRHLNNLGHLTNARIFLFIYMHSEDDHGDLYYGDDHSSPSVRMWWEDMISPRIAEITKAGNELYVGMLACGALVIKPRARAELTERLDKMGALHAFAFSTKELQPTLTTLFFYNFVHHILIEGTPLTQHNIATVLDQAVFIARHTPLFHFYLQTKKNKPTPERTVVEYAWTHDTMRPNGRDIGPQCPGCGSLYSRASKKKGDGKKDRRIVVWCKVTDCKWEEMYTIADNVKDLKTGENGIWTARDFTPPVPVTV